MGLPAFDMSAFDAVQATVAALPRASTTVFLRTTSAQQESHEEHQRRIRAHVNRVIDDTNEWRTKTLVEFASLEQAMKQALETTPLNVLQGLLLSHQERTESIRRAASENGRADQQILVLLGSSAKETALYSAEGAQFLRKQHKRLASVVILRAKTFERLIARWDQIENVIKTCIAKNVELLNSIMPRATQTFGSDEKAMNWLSKPSRALAYQSPIDALKENDGLIRVQDLLNRIDHGLAA